jgi:hypothetical protein
VGVRVSRPGCRDPLRALAHKAVVTKDGPRPLRELGTVTFRAPAPGSAGLGAFPRHESRRENPLHRSSGPALRAAAGGGRPRAGSDATVTGEPTAPWPEALPTVTSSAWPGRTA